MIGRLWGKLRYLFGEDLGYFAASLSFYTVFSIIPVFWVLFFLLSQFDGFADYYLGIRDFLISNIVPTHTDSVAVYLDGFLDKSRKMGMWGVVYIAIASVLFYQNYQYVVNKIFLMPNNSILHAIETYLILAVLMPAMLGGSFLLTGYLQKLASGYGASEYIYGLVSFLMIWLMFFVVYKVSPNMKIGIKTALLISFVVSLIWGLAKIVFVYYVFSNQTYTSLYGSLSVLLFLLLWIYLSWFLLLHGLRLCYLMQCHIDH